MSNNQKITQGQKQTMKKYVVFALMFVIFAACMYLIFAPSADEKAKQEASSGFNPDIPEPKKENIIDDKRSAYEDEQTKQRQEEKMRSLQDFGALMGDDTQKPANNLTLLDEPENAGNDGERTRSGSGTRPPQSSIQTSVGAYQDINRTLGNFYEPPKEDPEKERLAKEMEEMKAKLDESENKKSRTDEQLEMMEKSFQMAAKYLPLGTVPATNDAAASVPETSSTTSDVRKNTVIPVSQVTERTVSALQQDVSKEDFIDAYSQPRNIGFHTATATEQGDTKNTIAACIHNEQTITNGQNVRLRLLEPMQAGNTFIPSNALISGTAKIVSERLDISVTSLEYAGMIIPVELRVYDADGLPGIFIPGTQEVNAAKEIAANMGTSAGTSVNLSNDAKEQFVADMGRSLIQGTSQLFSKKLREVKVNLKAGYKIFLVPKSI